MAINISSKGGWPANVLSNFAATPFVFDGVRCNSAEGFIQALKFRNPEMQKHVCALVGKGAKMAGKKAADRIRREHKVWWQGQEFEFRSEQHFGLVERALRQKYTQSDRAKRALAATRDCALTHDVVQSDSQHTSLPADVFVRILYRIRAELQAADRTRPGR
jgi:predicted NAD-dependent protein-ADP-ribosyltransferase YbiA (DUF1768 family)